MKNKSEYKSLYSSLITEIWLTVGSIALIIILCVSAIYITPTIRVEGEDIVRIKNNLEAYNMEVMSINDRFLVGCGKGSSSGVNVTIKNNKGQIKEIKYCFGYLFQADSIKF